MRAQEFLSKITEDAELVPALINKTDMVDGIQVSVNADGANVTAYASSDGRRLGYVVFDRDGTMLVPYDLAVEERYRGQGIAAIMYDYVKSLGFKIKASADQTPAGQYFWQKNRGDERVWENFADGKGPGRPGDSQRHGIPKGATIAQLEKAAKAPGRKGQLARWQLNMRRGKKK
jgi:GNAT superfamily N-acetyltransferase